MTLAISVGMLSDAATSSTKQNPVYLLRRAAERSNCRSLSKGQQRKREQARLKPAEAEGSEPEAMDLADAEAAAQSDGTALLPEASLDRDATTAATDGVATMALHHRRVSS
jgi:hypothetical protein